MAARSAAACITFLLLAAALSFGFDFLVVNDAIREFLDTTGAILTVLAIGYTFYRLVDIPYEKFTQIARRSDSKLDDMLVPIISKSLRLTIIVLAFVQVAQVLSDKPITSIIAGLGIGGLAIALAGQESIRNLFGSVMIFLDKPFEIGDRIVVDGFDGPVEEVGLRSTKIRTLVGHLVTIPNGELANKTIQNIGKRPFIRQLTNISITYDTPPAKIDRALEIVNELLDNHEGMNPDFPPRVYFTEMKADCLNIMALYWYHPPEYWDYLAFNERFNKEIFRRFNKEGIDFAFPTQTLHLAGDPKRPLSPLKS